MTSAAQAELQSALVPGSLICLDTNCLLYYFKGQMPWAESLRPVFDAKDSGDVRLFTSSMTLAELLAKVDPTDQSAMLSAVRQYFDLIPVDDNIGIQAAGIRRASKKSVKTPDAVEMATANETSSLLFITNDEQLTRMPQTVKALYLKDLALDWLEDEFNGCLSASASAAIPNMQPQQMNLSFFRDVGQDWMILQSSMATDDFVRNAMLLSALVKGPCAVIGQASGTNRMEQVHSLRVLPAGRPWITPPVPDWVRHFTNKKCEWREPALGEFVQRVRRVTEMKDDEHRNKTNHERVKGITKDDLMSCKIPLPPLAVQERVVEVLQQTDAIRRKRAEARRLADQILPAVFHKMFGDPTKSQDLGKLGDVIESINNGITRRRKTPENAGTIVLRIQDVGDGYIDFDNINRIDLTEKEKKSFLLQEGDMLLVRVNGNRELVGRNSLFQSHFEPVGHNDHLMRIRFDREKVIPEYISAFLRTPFGRHELGMKVATSAGNHTINQNGIRNILIPLPDRPEQKKFLHIVQFIFDRQKTSNDSITHSHYIFSSLLNRAFTGELTAEWEAANADWIAERQAFYERLPRLALLSLLLEQRRRTGRKAVTLITALMKYAFLAQREGELRRRLYRFVPYHYGPCAMELYNDLKALQADGLVAIENGAEEEKTRITLTDPARATALLAEEATKDNARLAALEKAEEDTKMAADPVMSRLLKRRAETLETIRADAATVLDSYGNLDHGALLKMVCEKYPAYAKNSRVRKGRKSTTAKNDR